MPDLGADEGPANPEPRRGRRSHNGPVWDTHGPAPVQSWYEQVAPMLRILRRSVLLVAALLLPLYAVSLAERLEVPPQWREIDIGDSHPQVRTKLRASGLQDQQCEWLGSELSVRCTLVGQHHACGLAIRFDAAGADARVRQVQIREPVYTGPFHLHARLRRNLR